MKWSPLRGLHLLAHSDDAMPGVSSGATFGFFRDPVMNAIGDVAFLSGSNVTAWRYWRISAAGEMFMLLRQGQQAPLLPTGVLLGSPFFSVNSGDHETGDPVLSDNGSTFLDFMLEGVGIDETNDRALYHVGARGEYTTLVVREGDAIEVAHDDVRIVRKYLIGSAFRGGLGRKSTNARSDVAAKLEFEDGSEAIVVFVVPEPNFEVGLAFGFMVCVFLHRRKRARTAGEPTATTQPPRPART